MKILVVWQMAGYVDVNANTLDNGYVETEQTTYTKLKQKTLKNFMTECINKNVSPEDIDDYVDYWHTHETNCTLREFLGLTANEYVMWATHGNDVLYEIIKNRCEKK